MKKIIDKVNKQVNVQEGKRVIEQLLIECYFAPGISTKALARKINLPLPVTAAMKKELIREGILEQNQGVSFTEAGRALFEEACGYAGIDKRLYVKLMEMNFGDMKGELHDILTKLHHVFHGRPQVNVQLDQSKCTPETSLHRAILCLKLHALVGKQILCVGDDDLVSVSLCFLLKRLFREQRVSTKIVVMDVDERILEFIEEIARKERLPIRCQHYDLRQPLPLHMSQQFDCFFTDPPYTLQGMTLFLSRGISALKREKGLPIFLSFAHKSADFTLAMQREFVRMGLTVSQTLPHFNEYEGAEIIGNRSQMNVLLTTERTGPEITELFEDMLYTGEVRKTLRTYRCLRCRKEVYVGMEGQVRTIEELKNRGCSTCRNDTFQLIGKQTLK